MGVFLQHFARMLSTYGQSFSYDDMISALKGAMDWIKKEAFGQIPAPDGRIQIIFDTMTPQQAQHFLHHIRLES